MSITQPNIWNVYTLRPKNPEGQDDQNNFTFGDTDRTFPDNQPGFRTYSSTGGTAPPPSFLSTTSALRLPHSAPDVGDEFQTFFHDKWPYERGAYAPSALEPLTSWPTEAHGIPLQGPFDAQNVPLINRQGQRIDDWPFNEPGDLRAAQGSYNPSSASGAYNRTAGSSYVNTRHGVMRGRAHL